MLFSSPQLNKEPYTFNLLSWILQNMVCVFFLQLMNQWKVIAKNNSMPWCSCCTNIFAWREHSSFRRLNYTSLHAISVIINLSSKSTCIIVGLNSHPYSRFDSGNDIIGWVVGINISQSCTIQIRDISRRHVNFHAIAHFQYRFRSIQ